MKAFSSNLFEYSTLISFNCMRFKRTSFARQASTERQSIPVHGAMAECSIIKQNKTIKHEIIATQNDNYSLSISLTRTLMRKLAKHYFMM